ASDAPRPRRPARALPRAASALTSLGARPVLGARACALPMPPDSVGQLAHSGACGLLECAGVREAAAAAFVLRVDLIRELVARVGRHHLAGANVGGVVGVHGAAGERARAAGGAPGGAYGGAHRAF